MSAKAKAVVFLVGATLCWAGNYVVGAAAVRGMSPPSLVGGALVLAGVYFTSRTAARETSRETSRQDARFAKSAKRNEG